MRVRSLISILMILSSAACLDRINIDTGDSAAFSIVVDGYISDQPGPYKIEISNAFDPESSLKHTGVSVKQVMLSDDHGTNEVLSEVDKGVYQTDSTGIKGVIGRTYKLRIELFDGRIYESIPDTLLSYSGSVDSVYYEFRSSSINNNGSTNYGFDIFFNSFAGTKSNFRYLWKFTGTFQTDTRPDLDLNEPCSFDVDCNQCSICNGVPRCSGLRNFGSPITPILVRVAPCTCCRCWYNTFNAEPILSDSQLHQLGHFTKVKAYFVPLDRGIFQNKIYVKVSQMSLTSQALRFWKAIKDQKDDLNSLFLPITGKIPDNLIQTSGPQAKIAGLFFATSITSKTIVINRKDVPNLNLIPLDSIPIPASCLEAYPYATTMKPPSGRTSMRE